MKKVYRSSCILYSKHNLFQGYSKHTSRHDLVCTALFSKDFPEVPSHEAVGMAASASAEVTNHKKS